ncbi:MAG TPA: LuxR C-terminal-related transcriptional regulator [Symbiobacteriaceae bacterium]|nr:LuxR C-terminal-related transcriptional regulator [Symbiobacteriaceae bacterium]
MAAALFISENTVKTHISNLFQKLDVRDRTEAVTRALSRGLIRI